MLIASLISGQASIYTGEQTLGDGVVNLEDLEISISDYFLLESDTPRVKSIRLEVYDAGIDESAEILVTTDGGGHWASCKWIDGTTWLCTYPEQDAPLIIDIESIEVIIKG